MQARSKGALSGMMGLAGLVAATACASSGDRAQGFVGSTRGAMSIAPNEPDCTADGWCLSAPSERSFHPRAARAFGADNVVIVGDDAVRRWDGASWTETKFEAPGSSRVSAWVAAPNDAWVCRNGKVSRWNGTALATLPPPAPSGCSGVGGTSPNDVWVLGFGSSISHWDGARWGSVPAPVVADTAVSIRDVWGTLPDRIYAVASGYAPHLEPGTLFRWDGRAWSRVETGAPHWLTNVWGTRDDDVWAWEGYVFAPEPSLVHFDGTEWTQVAFTPAASVLSLGGAGPDDEWAVTFERGRDFAYRIVLRHWDGTAWTENPVALPIAGPYSPAVVTGSASDDAWIFGTNEAIHWDGATWSAPRPPIAPLASGSFGIWGSSANDVWAVRTFGVSHWDGIAWRDVKSSEALGGSAVWGSSRNDVWVAGLSGSAFHYDGTTWTKTPTNTKAFLDALWGSAPNDVWGVGSYPYSPLAPPARIVRWNGDEWVPYSVGEITLGGVWGGGPNDVWAVGANTILHWNGTAWTSVAIPAGVKSPNLLSVWGSSTTDVYAAGPPSYGGPGATSPGVLLHWDGTAWSVVTTAGPNLGGVAVSGTNANDVWLLGFGPTSVPVAHHWDGATWTKATLFGSTFNPRALWAGPSDVWASTYDTLQRFTRE